MKHGVVRTIASAGWRTLHHNVFLYNALMTSSTTSPSLKEPHAFIPIAFSLTALAVTTMAITANGVVREADEGTAAHLFQLFMAASFIMSVAFVIRWLVCAPWQTLRILAIQIVAALVALAPVFYFKL